VPDTARHASTQVVFESYPVLGFNYRMTDIQAAVGREQLKRLPSILERRRALARRYLEALADVPGLRLPSEPGWARTNWQSFCVVLPPHLDQRQTMQRLLDAGVSTRRGIMNAHREAAYPAGTWRCGPGGLRESEDAQDHGVLLPLFHELAQSDQDRVVEALRACCV
jgi:dTDP-4-amino-4,6-dideoxygalactose transaminase